MPERFRDVDQRRFAKVSLETRDLSRAEKLKASVERELEAYWLSLKRGGSTDALDRYNAAIERVRLEGFDYVPASDLAAAELTAIRARVARLEELGIVAPDDASPPATPVAEAAVEALLGGTPPPRLSLGTALDRFYTLTRDRVRRKSDDQVRRWKAPRAKAVANLIAIAGDKPLTEVTRADAVALKAWWVERVIDEGYTPNSANKDIGHLAQLFDVLNEQLQLGIAANPFARLRIPDDEKGRRAPFSVDHLRAIVVDPAKLAGLNDDARYLLLAMVETGMRPTELCGLEPDDIILDHEVPHVIVRPKEGRQLKTPYSRRELPLVGVSLAAFLASPQGFPRYRDRSSQLSALVNKVMRGRGLLPTDDHSLYSIRHTFQDRLTAVDMPDRVQAELMGHKFDRPVYGEGPTLAHKREWLLRIAITETPAAGAGRGQLRLF